MRTLPFDSFQDSFLVVADAANPNPTKLDLGVLAEVSNDLKLIDWLLLHFVTCSIFRQQSPRGWVQRVLDPTASILGIVLPMRSAQVNKSDAKIVSLVVTNRTSGIYSPFTQIHHRIWGGFCRLRVSYSACSYFKMWGLKELLR